MNPEKARELTELRRKAEEEVVKKVEVEKPVYISAPKKKPPQLEPTILIDCEGF